MTDSYQPSSGKRRVFGLFLSLAGVLLAFALLFAPLIRYQTVMVTKTVMGGTPGDEACLAAKAELTEKSAAYLESTGIPSDVRETIDTEAEKVVYTLVSTPQALTGLDFLRSELSCRYLLMAVPFLLAAAFLLARPWVQTDAADSTAKCLRSLAVGIALFSFLLIPAFLMRATYQLSRIPKLYIKNLIEDETAANTVSAFLFHSELSQTKQMLRNLSLCNTGWNLLLMGAALLSVLGLLQVRSRQIRSSLCQIGIYTFVIILAVIILYPYYVMLITAFRSNAEATDMNFQHLFPTVWIFSNLTDIINRGVLTYLKNSLLLSFGATLVALLCGIPAAYAMSRFSFKGKKVYLGFVVMSQMFSPVVLLVGISRLMVSIHLDDSVTGLMLINAAFNLALTIWLLRGTFVAISSEMEQAAQIDGCSTVGAMVRILLPMAAPGIVTCLIFVFINSWNEFTISNVLITSTANKPITVGINQFSSFTLIEWQYLFACSLLATIPVVILFMCIEKHLTAGLTAGGVKG